MAILKHFNVHNRNYNNAVMYLMYEHDSHAAQKLAVLYDNPRIIHGISNVVSLHFAFEVVAVTTRLRYYNG